MSLIKEREPVKLLANGVLLALVGFLGFVVVAVQGHGYLYDPPGRSSLWRYNSIVKQVYPGAVANYDDNSLYCGGFGVGSIALELFHLVSYNIYIYAA